MLALALLLAVDPPPATVRVEVTDRMVIEGEADPPIWTTEALEIAVAADGTFSARVSGGGRTRTFSGKVGRERGRWMIELEYKDVTRTGRVSAVGGRWVPALAVHTVSTRVSPDVVGKPATCSELISTRQTIDGREERVSRSLAVTLRPRGVEAAPRFPEEEIVR